MPEPRRSETRRSILSVQLTRIEEKTREDPQGDTEEKEAEFTEGENSEGENSEGADIECSRVASGTYQSYIEELERLLNQERLKRVQLEVQLKNTQNNGNSVLQ